MEAKEFETKIYKFISEVLELPGTKNSPEMVSAISELLSSLKSISYEKT